MKPLLLFLGILTSIILVGELVIFNTLNDVLDEIQIIEGSVVHD